GHGLQRKRLPAPSAARVEDLEGLTKELERQLLLAQVGMGHADVVQGVRDGLRRAESSARRKRPAVIGESHARLAECGVQRPEIARRLGLPGLVYEGAPNG